MGFNYYMVMMPRETSEEENMAIDLMNLQPTKISRDLSGYITYLYGPND